MCIMSQMIDVCDRDGKREVSKGECVRTRWKARR